MGIYESSGRSYADPIGVVAFLTGFAGAVLSGALWLVHFQPDTEMLGSYGARLADSSQFADQIAVLAAVLGCMAVMLGIVSSTRGRARLGTSLSIVLGLLALSYPVLNALNMVAGPLRPNLGS
jgi:hypothetical protein